VSVKRKIPRFSSCLWVTRLQSALFHAVVAMFSQVGAKWVGGLLLGLVSAIRTAQAAPWVDAALFGADPATLQHTFPDMRKLPKPQWGPGGSRGLWALPVSNFAGYAFEGVVFLRDNHFQRLEYRWHSDAHPCLARAVFDDVVQSFSAKLGAPMLSGSLDAPDADIPGIGKTAFWVAYDTDFIAYVEDTNMRCSVRLVNRPRALRNADSL